MALTATSLSASLGTVDQSAKKQTVTLYGRFLGADLNETSYAFFEWGISTRTDVGPYHIITGLNGYPFEDADGGDKNYVIDGVLHGSFSQTPYLAKMACDTTYQWRARITDTGGGSKNGSTLYTKTYAITPTAGTLSSSSVTTTTATITSTAYYVNTSTSTATVWLEYKKASDSTWTTAGTADTGKSGYGSDTITESLTGLTANTLYNYRLQMTRTTVNETTLTSATSSFTTLPDVPSVSTNATTSITHSTATLNGYLTHNTFDGNAYFKYGTDNPPTQYTTANQAKTASGAFTQAITGLTSSATYYVRAYYAYSGGTVQGAVATFDTTAPPAIPDITTDAPTDITTTFVMLNGTVNANGITDTYYYFQIGLTTAYTFGDTAPRSTSGKSPLIFHAAVSGLTANTLYHCRAVAGVGATLYYGSDVQFTTLVDPEATAVKEDHVQVYEYDRIYGAATTVYFPLVTPSATTSDTFLPAATADPFQANDCQISLDGADFAPTNSLAVKTFDWLYKLDLLAAETAAEDVWIIIHDANGTAYRDCALHIRTKIQTGQITANADNIATNTDALVLVNNGTGKAINATGSVAISGDITAANITLSNDLTIANDLAVGNNLSVGGDVVVSSDISVTGSISATSIAGVLTSMVLRTATHAGGGAGYIDLDASATTTADYYKGAIIVVLTGTGAGQSRAITAYSAARRCTVAAWATNPTGTGVYMIIPGEEFWANTPTAELAAMPAVPGSSYGQLLQFIFQRFAYPRRQDATTQKLYLSTGNAGTDTGGLASGAFEDKTSYQTIGKLATDLD